MSKTIGIISIKGGVGKTTVSAAIASDLAVNHKKRVLLVDANFSAPNLSEHMGLEFSEKTIHHVLDNKVHIKSAIQNKFGVDVIPGSYVYSSEVNHLKLKDKLNQIKGNYDFVVIDSSPTLDDEVLATILASDALFVVTTPDVPTISCSIKAAKLAKHRGKPIAGVIINKVRDPRFELTFEEIEDGIGFPVLAKIPDDKVAVRSLFTKVPIPIYNKRSYFAREISKLNFALVRKKRVESIFEKLFPRNLPQEEINRQIFKDKFYDFIFNN